MQYSKMPFFKKVRTEYVLLSVLSALFLLNSYTFVENIITQRTACDATKYVEVAGPHPAASLQIACQFQTSGASADLPALLPAIVTSCKERWGDQYFSTFEHKGGYFFNEVTGYLTNESPSKYIGMKTSPYMVGTSMGFAISNTCGLKCDDAIPVRQPTASEADTGYVAPTYELKKAAFTAQAKLNIAVSALVVASNVAYFLWALVSATVTPARPSGAWLAIMLMFDCSIVVIATVHNSMKNTELSVYCQTSGAAFIGSQFFVLNLFSMSFVTLRIAFWLVMYRDWVNTTNGK